MNYMGPPICPTTQFYGSHKNGSKPATFRVSTTSFCSRVGSDMFDAAMILCDEQFNWTQYYEDWDRTLACTLYDSYVGDQLIANDPNSSSQGDTNPKGPWWFAWDTQRNWIEPYYFESSPNDGTLTDDYNSYWQQEVFMDIVTKTADQMCRVQESKDMVTALCLPTLFAGATTTMNSSCVQARIDEKMADTCSGEKEDDAAKCRKACQSTVDYTVGVTDTTPFHSTRESISDLMNSYMWWIIQILQIVAVCRSIAGLVTTYQTLRDFYRQQPDGAGKFRMLLILDSMGIFDTCQTGLSATDFSGEGGSEDDED